MADIISLFCFDCSLLGLFSFFIETLVSINFTDQNSPRNSTQNCQMTTYVADWSQQLGSNLDHI